MWWILLGIFLFLVGAITVIGLLPVYIIIKSDEHDSFYLRYKFLNKLYGDEEEKDNTILKSLKSATGLSRLDKKSIQQNLKDNRLLQFLREDLPLLVEILKELLRLLKRCKAKTFQLQIVCADTDAAAAAIKYGLCTAAVYPLLGYLHSAIKFRPAGEKIDISCDFTGGKSSFALETVLVVRVYRVFGALVRILLPQFKQALRESVTAHKNQASN